MENKTILRRTNLSTPHSTFYRSTRYKITPSPADTAAHSAYDISKHPTPLPQTQTPTPPRPKSFSLKPHQPRSFRHKHSPSEDSPPYLETWGTLLKGTAGKEAPKTSRVCLPLITDFEPSLFTALDPLFIPIDHIKVEVG